MSEAIDPTLAVALAKAAGLDATDLERQVRRREAGDDDPEALRARIEELERQAARPAEASADPQQEANAEFLKQLTAAADDGWTSTTGLLGR